MTTLDSAAAPCKQCHRPGLVIWLTGLSSAGKTTLGNELLTILRGRGRATELLDGDIVRRELCRDLGFSKEDRDENIRRIGFLVELLVRNGIVVIVAAISPYRSTRDEIRSRITDFVEVYVNAPIEVCERRDVKGFYQKARLGKLCGFTGISDPYEAPLHPDVVCHTDIETVSESVQKIMSHIRFRLERVT